MSDKWNTSDYSIGSWSVYQAVIYPICHCHHMFMPMSIPETNRRGDGTQVEAWDRLVLEGTA